MKLKVIAIRRENYGTHWDRRAPLNPTQVQKLIAGGIKVIAQPSGRRAYSDAEYEKVGAVIEEDLSEASLIIGIKQVPIPDLIPNKTYAFFAHVIKAQADNMDMMDAILKRNIRLMDWETMIDFNGNRMDKTFGRFAGFSGMLNILNGMGLRYLGLGYNTPFIYIAAPHHYPTLASACSAVKYTGELISKGRIHDNLGGPITFVFLGDGAVSKGAQYVLNNLPVEYVEPSNFKEVAQNGDKRKVYATKLRTHNHMVRKSGEPGFNRKEYETHPERYRSIFPEEFAPYASCIINCVLWTYEQPRTLSLADGKRLFGTNKTDGNQVANSHSEPPPAKRRRPDTGTTLLKHRLTAICDITADPGGSIECVTDCTPVEAPFDLYNVDTGKSTSMGFSGDGILICSVPNMPSQLPTEAIDTFGEIVVEMIPEMASFDASKPLIAGQFKPEIQKSIIASNGKLTPDFEYINKLRAAQNAKNSIN